MIRGIAGVGLGLGCLAVLVVVVLILAVMGVGTYNSLVGTSQAVDAQWAQVENVYQRRADLIPNLVATVQGAANFERSTLEAVTQARASVGRVQMNAGNITNDPQAFARFEQAQGALSSALSRLMVVVERYPDLKANANFRELQSQLEGSENRIAVERMRYNEKAQEYNTARLRFPATIFARLLGFGEKAYFRSQPGAEQAPPVNFNFGASPAAPSPPPTVAPTPVPTAQP
jgi:LemA protein